MAGAIVIDEQQLEGELAALARITDAAPVADGVSVTRVLFTKRDLEARAWLKGLARAEGFGVREDAVGNLFVRLEGSEPALPAVATGSHIDAIPHAGMYDGTVGVLGGLAALRALRRVDRTLRRAVELIVFTAEEPTRFGIGCLGSRLLAGALETGRADALTDAEGRTLAEVRAEAGYRGSLDDVRLAQGHYSAWLELHIEQGSLLERAGLGLGIVTGIAAPASYRFTLTGLGGHAGALLMPDRRDALCAAAELILALERAALATGSLDTVATIGTCDVHPGAVNSVPSRVVLEADVRDTDPVRRESVLQEVRAQMARVQAERGVSITEDRINADEPAVSDPGIVRVLEEICVERGLRTRNMVSRAYHDSLFMAQIAPAAMLFVPCRGGVSHRPEEYASPTDIACGASVLAEALARLASRE